MENTEKHTKERFGKKTLIKSMIDGSFLTRNWVLEQIPFVLVLALLGVIYIGNRYHAEKILRETINISAELKELRSEAITTTSKLMFKSKQSEVIKLVEKNNLGLKEAVEPPHKLIVKTDE